jgi:hypothetical protein
MNRLSTEVTEKLNQEKTTNNYNAPSVGSLLAVPMDQTLLRGIRFISGGAEGIGLGGEGSCECGEVCL